MERNTSAEVRPATDTPRPTPTTQAGRDLLDDIAGAFSRSENAEFDRFRDAILAIEAEARDATGLREALDALIGSFRPVDNTVNPLLVIAAIAALAAAPPESRWPPDEGSIHNWPGGGGRVRKDPTGEPTWASDPDGAWVVLYAPRQFYDGLAALREGAERP